jgi:Tfp pilus assembly protein PilF
MKKIKLIICMAALLLSMPVLRAVEDDEEDVYFILMGQADEAIKAEKYSEAVTLLNEALRIDPENPSNVLILSNLGMIYSYMDQDSLSLESLNKALDIAPSMVTVLENRGRQLLKMNRDTEAYADFESALAIDSISTTARFYHGMMALYGGDAKIAKRDFDVLEEIVPNIHSTKVAMATYYSLMRQDKEAIPYYKDILKVDPSPEYYASLAGCYLATDDLNEASATIQSGMERYPSDGELYYYRTWLDLKRFRNDDAKADAKKAIELGVNPAKIEQLFKQK